MTTQHQRQLPRGRSPPLSTAHTDNERTSAETLLFHIGSHIGSQFEHYLVPACKTPLGGCPGHGISDSLGDRRDTDREDDAQVPYRGVLVHLSTNKRCLNEPSNLP